MKHTEQSLLREYRQIQKQIKLVNLQKEALKATILSEGITDALVDLIFGPFLHLSALKLRNTKEWRDTMTKVKELEKKAIALNQKADKSYELYQQMLANKAAKRNQNTRSFKPTKAL
jgi:hypothetical protein